MRILIGALMFFIMVAPAYALTVNAQDTTVCNSGFCYTTVDLGKYLITGQVTAVKGLNLTSYLPVKSGVKSMDYTIKGTVINISGYTLNRVYWNMNLSTYLSIDPYWTYSGDSVLNQVDALGDPSGDAVNMFGIKFKTNESYSVNFVGVHYASNTYTVTRIYGSDGSTVICTNNTAGMGGTGWANFTGCVLNASTNYSVVGVPSGTRIYKSPGTFPQNNKDITLLAGISTTPPLGAGNTLIFEYDKLVTQIATWTNETIGNNILYINGNSTANQTGYNNTPVNLTSTTNITGMWVALYINGTLSGNTSNLVVNITSFNAGAWNITSLTGSNTTHNGSSTTRWINISNLYLSANYTSYQVMYCLTDNRTLFTNLTYTLPQLQNYYNYTSCVYGCDNTTQRCRANPLEENLILLGVIGFFLMGAYYLWRNI